MAMTVSSSIRLKAGEAGVPEGEDRVEDPSMEPIGGCAGVEAGGKSMGPPEWLAPPVIPWAVGAMKRAGGQGESAEPGLSGAEGGVGSCGAGGIAGGEGTDADPRMAGCGGCGVGRRVTSRF